jgi:hypothetical protein
MSGRTESWPPPDDELWSLVDAFVAGTASAGERDRLEARLRAEAGARRFYVAYLDLHAHLQWTTRGASAAPPAPRRPRPGGFLTRWRVAVAASVALAVGFLAAVLTYRHGPEEGEAPDIPLAPPGSVAVLVDAHDTVWEADMALPTASGSALPPGRLKLRAGVAEVAFHGGGEVLLEGPAEFDVSAPDHGFLHRGKLLAMVPAGAPAFRVGMPGVVVTDRGGQCGLLRDESGRTEVHVFEGQVGADPTGRPGEPLPPLPGNAGARVDDSGRTLTPVPLNETTFARLRTEVWVSDAAVRGGQFAGRNFAMSPRLMVKNSIPDYCWEAYLRFDLSGIKGKVSDARVRLVPLRVGQPFQNAVAVVPDNQWGETAITWSTRPPAGPPFATWTVREGEPVEFDVTGPVQEALAGDRKLSLRVFAPNYERGKSFVQYGSRKGGAESRPQLLVTTEP